MLRWEIENKELFTLKQQNRVHQEIQIFFMDCIVSILDITSKIKIPFWPPPLKNVPTLNDFYELSLNNFLNN